MFKICLTVLMFLGLFVGQSRAVVFGGKPGGGPSHLYKAPHAILGTDDAKQWFMYADQYCEELSKLSGVTVPREHLAGLENIGSGAGVLGNDDMILALRELRGLLSCIFEGQEFILGEAVEGRSLFHIRKGMIALETRFCKYETDKRYKSWFEGLDSLSALIIRANQVWQKRAVRKRMERARRIEGVARVVMSGAVVASVGFAILHEAF